MFRPNPGGPRRRVALLVGLAALTIAAGCSGSSPTDDDGVIIGGTVDAELEPGSPDHLVFTGENITGRQEASGIRCRVALGRGMFGGRASVELDGVTLVVESGAGPPLSMTLRKIADWPEPT